MGENGVESLRPIAYDWLALSAMATELEGNSGSVATALTLVNNRKNEKKKQCVKGLG